MDIMCTEVGQVGPGNTSSFLTVGRREQRDEIAIGVSGAEYEFSVCIANRSAIKREGRHRELKTI